MSQTPPAETVVNNPVKIVQPLSLPKSPSTIDVEWVQQKDVMPFADEIRAFKQKDSISQPQKNGILMIGSSSVRRWDDFEHRFPNPKMIRRGIGGSTLAQLVEYFLPYVVFPYHPSKIFVYDGENDIAEAGASAEQVLANYNKLISRLQLELPKTEIYILTIKYSPSRARFSAVFKATNDLLAAYVKNKKGIHLINVTDALILANGKSDPSLFQNDMLHLNTAGYDKWDKILRPYFL